MDRDDDLELWDEATDPPAEMPGGGMSLRAGLNLLSVIVAIAVIFGSFALWLTWGRGKTNIATIPGPAIIAQISFTSIAMRSAQEGWATGVIPGDYDHPTRTIILHFMNNGWALDLDTTSIPELRVITVTPAGDVWAGGEDGYILHRPPPSATCLAHSCPNMPEWVTMRAPNQGRVTHIAMVSPTEGWAVQAGGGLFHYTAAKGEWILVPVKTGEPYPNLTGIAMLAPTDGWAVGAGGFLHYDGHAWTERTDIPASQLVAITLFSSGDGWATENFLSCQPHLECDLGGTQVIMFHYTQGQWTKAATLPDRGVFITAIQMPTPDDAWAVGQHIGQPHDTILYHCHNGAWRRVAFPQKGQLVGVAMTGPDTGWVVGTQGVLARDDNGVWAAAH